MRNIWLCILIAVCMLTWFILIVTFTPTYLVTVKGLSPSSMANVMTFIGVAWVIWGIVTPALSDRIGRKVTMVVFSAVAVLCPLAVVYVASTAALSVIVLVTFVGVGCFGLFLATIPGETVSHGALATALVLVMGVAEISGGAFAPVIAGAASDAWGLQSAMFIAAGAAVLAALLSFGLHETAPRVLQRHRIVHAEVPGVAEYQTR